MPADNAATRSRPCPDCGREAEDLTDLNHLHASEVLYCPSCDFRFEWVQFGEGDDVRA